MEKIIVLLVFVGYSCCKEKVYIGAMIPRLRPYDRYCYQSAMKAAVELINNDTRILKDYELVIRYEQSSVSIIILTSYNYIHYLRKCSVIFNFGEKFTPKLKITEIFSYRKFWYTVYLIKINKQ